MTTPGQTQSGVPNASGWWQSAGERRIFFANPSQPAPWPTIIVIHGVNGLGENMENVCREFAREGYRAVAPDLYAADFSFRDHAPEDIEMAAHMGRDPERQKRFLAELDEDRRPRIVAARAWISARKTDGYVDILRHCFDDVSSDGRAAGIGTLGYCMGGRLVGELAVQGVDVRAHVVYYGSAPPLDAIPSIRGAFQGHYSISDIAITDKIPEFAAAMAKAGKPFEYFLYDAPHGFSLTPASRAFDPEATRVSMERIKAFFVDRFMEAVAPD